MTQTNTTPELNIALTVEEVNVVLSALGELPAKVSMNLLNKIGMQARQQLENIEVSGEPKAE